MWCLRIVASSARPAPPTASPGLLLRQLSYQHASTSASPAARCWPLAWSTTRMALFPITARSSLGLGSSLSKSRVAWNSWSRQGLLPSAGRTLLSRSVHSVALHPSSLSTSAQWQHHTAKLYMQYMSWNILSRLSPYMPNMVIPNSQGLLALLLPFYRHLPDLRLAHLQIISAINLAGNNLLRTFAIFIAEVTRLSGSSQAEPFDFYVQPASHEVFTETAMAWWRVVPVDLFRSMLHILRLTYLFILFAPVIFSSPLALTYDLYRDEWMELLRNTLQTAGPAFIKWGQWAATRLDLFPPDMCAELEKLQTQAPSHSFKMTKRAVEAAFCMSVGDLFDELDEEPVASGSIGQIHRAVLSHRGAVTTGCCPGQVVAVKVRHPGVAETITQDFEAMLWVAHIFGRWPAIEHLRLEDTLKQFAAPLKEQVDLAREANNLQRFNYNFRNTKSVRFPVPLYPLVSTDVLVETFEEGDHITTYIQSQHNPHNHRLSILGSGTMLQMMLVDNLIHSDLHPGNILVRLEPPAGLMGMLYNGLERMKGSEKVSVQNRARIDNLQQSWLQPQIVLLDVGMATELTTEDQRNMVGLFRGLAMLDGRECGIWTLRFSGRQQTCPNPEGFKDDMERAFTTVRLASEVESLPIVVTTQSQDSTQDAASCSSEGAGAEVVFNSNADALGSVLELVRQHQVCLPGHICAAVVTTLVLEGWSNKLDPDHSVLSQVNKMFESSNLRWAERITRSVDEVMEFEDTRLVLE